MFEDDYLEEDSEDADENQERCRQCEVYQQEVYQLNCRLRSFDFTSPEYEVTRQKLGDAVQLQLRHQRKHI